MSEHIHRETTDERLNAIARLIEDNKAEIARLELEAERLRNGDISLRSLGLPRSVLYSFWHEELRTVGDARAWIAKYGSLRGLRGLGQKKMAIALKAMEAYGTDTDTH